MDTAVVSNLYIGVPVSLANTWQMYSPHVQ